MGDSFFDFLRNLLTAILKNVHGYHVNEGGNCCLSSLSKLLGVLLSDKGCLLLKVSLGLVVEVKVSFDFSDISLKRWDGCKFGDMCLGWLFALSFDLGFSVLNLCDLLGLVSDLFVQFSVECGCVGIRCACGFVWLGSAVTHFQKL